MTGTLYKDGQAIKTLSVSSSAYGAQANGKLEVNKGDVITYSSSNDFNTYVQGNAFTAMAMIVVPL